MLSSLREQTATVVLWPNGTAMICNPSPLNYYIVTVEKESKEAIPRWHRVDVLKDEPREGKLMASSSSLKLSMFYPLI
jgi:hypothetical protein